MLEKGLKPAAIAREIDRPRGTIYQKIKRNTDENGNYIAHNAQKKASERKKKCGAKRKLENAVVRKYVIEKLENCWSPEQIAERAKQLGLFFRVSYPTIYRAIYSGLLPLVLKKKLRRKGRGDLTMLLNSGGRFPMQSTFASVLKVQTTGLGLATGRATLFLASSRRVASARMSSGSLAS